MTPAVPPMVADAVDGQLDAIRRAPAAAASRMAAREIEVVFLTQLLQAMRRTIPENDLLPRSPERDVYDGVFDRTVAQAMSAADPLGLVRTLESAGGLKVGANPADNSGGGPGKGGHEPAVRGPRSAE